MRCLAVCGRSEAPLPSNEVVFYFTALSFRFLLAADLGEKT